MSGLVQLRLEALQHRGVSIWFDCEDGTMYYGRDRHNLSFPEGLEAACRFPPLYLADLKRAFLLGKAVGGDISL